MIKILNIIILVANGFSMPVFAQDLDSEFKSEKLMREKLELANKNIILNSVEISCNYHKDWGNTLFRIKSDIYKNIDGKIIRVSSLKNGKSNWKEKIYTNYEVIYIDWQLIDNGSDEYTIYMKLPIVGISQHKCRS